MVTGKTVTFPPVHGRLKIPTHGGRSRSHPFEFQPLCFSMPARTGASFVSRALTLGSVSLELAFFSLWHFNINSQYSLPQRRLPSHCWPIKYQLSWADKGNTRQASSLLSAPVTEEKLSSKQRKLGIWRLSQSKSPNSVGYYGFLAFRLLCCRAGGGFYFLFLCVRVCVLFLIIQHRALLRFPQEGRCALN